MIYRKGLHTLLEALRQVRSPVRVDVVGSLTSEQVYVKLLNEIMEKNHLTSVHFHGSLDREPLVERLKQAHVLVVPSSYEGYGIVYLEGMCFGLPAIGTSAGAAGEIIENGKSGCLISRDDAVSLARHLQALADDRKLLGQLSLNARGRSLRQPAWTVSAKNIRDFFYSFGK